MNIKLTTAFTLTSLLTACTPRIVYQKVYIPTKCNIIKPEKPPAHLDYLSYLKELLIRIK
ncbi:hypothetical protein [Helicobacter suis]|uniref:hypothetical protein n=1 Tax=Helicobacter suis TaxID=104628 RepID=UPI0013D6B090|nr:hypothetical protein [Helicobacter suis]